MKLNKKAIEIFEKVFANEGHIYISDPNDCGGESYSELVKAFENLQKEMEEKKGIKLRTSWGWDYYYWTVGNTEKPEVLTINHWKEKELRKEYEQSTN